MKTPGDLLRDARKAKGLSLSEAAAMTRIPRTKLGHLEKDRFDEFTAEVFVRGHLRNYSRELGLVPEEVMKSYERHTGRHPGARDDADDDADESAEVVDVATSSEASPRPKPPKTGGLDLLSDIRPMHMIALALVLIGIVVFVSLLAGNRATAEDPAKFPEVDEEQWEIEQDVKETRWLLEQPANADDTEDADESR